MAQFVYLIIGRFVMCACDRALNIHIASSTCNIFLIVSHS
jgi:hypothetical protein